MSAQQPKEFVFNVDERVGFKGMVSRFSASTLPANTFLEVKNCFFNSDFEIITRKGSRVLIDATAVTTQPILDCVLFLPAVGAAYFLFVSDSKLFKCPIGLNETPVFIANLNAGTTVANIAILKNKAYIADGKDAWVFDGTTMTLVTFPVVVGGAGNVKFVLATLNRIWWFTENDWVFGSVPNAPDELDNEGLGSFKAQIDIQDGAKMATAVRWGNTFVFSKTNPSLGLYTMYWMRGIGSSTDPFRVERMFGDPRNPTAFLGRSAVEIGNDVIGLTPSGFNSLAAINNYKEAETESLSRDIQDFIQRINVSQSDKIAAVYDSKNRLYMCAVPLDGAIKNNCILVYHVDTQHWSYYTNWSPACWVQYRRDIFYGDFAGKLIQINQGTSDQGLDYDKYIRSADWDGNYPDMEKVFKSLAFDLEHFGRYNVEVKVFVDGEELPENFNLPITGNPSLWDEFVWDVDYWDSQGSIWQRLYIAARGKRIGYSLRTKSKDQPFSLRGIVYRTIKKGILNAKSPA